MTDIELILTMLAAARIVILRRHPGQFTESDHG